MQIRAKQSWRKHLDFIILDAIALLVAYLCAYIVREGFRVTPTTMYHRQMVFVYLIIHICVAVMTENYKDILRRSAFIEISKVLKHNVIISLIALLYMYLNQISLPFSRMIFAQQYVFSCIFMFGVRFIWKAYLRTRIVQEKNQAVVLVVTIGDSAEQIVKKFKHNGLQSYRVGAIALMDSSTEALLEESIDSYGGVPVIARERNVDKMLQYAMDHVIDEVFISLPDTRLTRNIAMQFLDMGITVHISMEEMLVGFPNQSMENFGGHKSVSSSLTTVSSVELAIKRLMDIVGSLVGLVFTGIAFIIYAPIIYKQSPGPIIFKQKRVGKGGRIFEVYKFRSMYMDAEERKKELMAKNKMKGQMFKLDNDPRIIPIGKFMRRMSIDELPQFYNILKGDMSLVGTRPPTLDEVAKYKLHHKVRLSVKPGLTGMWQVSGRSNITDFEEVVALDEKYISEWSLALDIKILFQTIYVVFTGKGAS
jgi:exopolysaccharide biosynthesis polyprenyl glycosylphosphotransferase